MALKKNPRIRVQGLESSADVVPPIRGQRSRIDDFSNLRDRASELGTIRPAQRHPGSPDPFLVKADHSPAGTEEQWLPTCTISRNLTIGEVTVLPQLGEGRDPELRQV